MNPRFLAIEIGGTKLQFFVGDEQGGILHRHRCAVDITRGGEGIRGQIGDVLPPLLSSFAPAAVAIGFGGPVDWRDGTICCSHQVSGWSNFPLAAWMEELTRLPVVVENDSNAASYGEACIGAGRNCNPVFYFNMGSGVGGGLVVEGQLYHGRKPGEVEFGHLRMGASGGTVEDSCSGWAVDRMVREAASPGSLLARLLADKPAGGEARHLLSALDDPAACRILDGLGQRLGFALSHVVHLFHPEVIVMGGGLSLLGEPLRQRVAEQLPRHVMEAFHPVPEVRLSLLGEDAVPAGVLLLAARAQHKG